MGSSTVTVAETVAVTMADAGKLKPAITQDDRAAACYWRCAA